jgi:Kdo2-lipid IVA lauroyltransferase/acyltransferase
MTVAADKNENEPRLRRKRETRRLLPDPEERQLSTRERLRYSVEHAGFRFARLACRALGLERASALSGWFWQWLGPMSGRHRRAARNLEASLPELTAAERKAVLLGMWDNFGRTFAEGFFLAEILADAERLQVDPEAEALSREGAVVYGTLHTGNWEVAAAASTRIGCRLAGVYQRLKNPMVEADILAIRRPLYTGGLYEKGSNLVHVLTSWSRAGNPVGIVSDQRDPRGIEVPFFGRPAPSTPFPAYLARKTDVPLLAIRVVRLPHARFRVEMKRVRVPNTDNRLEDIRVTTAALQATFETWIRERPEQWMWTHRRWG